ncbi:MAG: UTP--glucose-1-phosphate uridylyltransferase [Sulfuricurvum sp. PC08-66]|nr:MAG: UTP--glucose-1-phosphate uridylyltransferase [Sulfuricurvum sp. PC08-66]
MSEIRYDRLHDTHVIIAPERLHRPDCGIDMGDREGLGGKKCPFCEGNEALTPREIFALRKEGSYPNEKGWRTRVVPNLYRALQIETPHRHHYGAFEHWEGFGAHEIIIDTPRHVTSMTQLTTQELVAWLETMRARVADLRHDRRIAYIALFKNEGIHAGATQMHLHTQLIGLPFVPPHDRHRFARYIEHHRVTGEALLDTIVANELEEQKRIIASNENFLLFCPYASAYPFEVMIAARRNVGQIDTLSQGAMEQIASLLALALERLRGELGIFDFNLSITTPPLQPNNTEIAMLSPDEVCRFALRIMPRLYRHGGFEAATGIIINPVAPELAAKILANTERADG